MSDPSKHRPILFSTNAFGQSEVELALRAIRAEFAVDEVPLQRGGPDYFVIAFTMAYPLVAGILSSAIWDGIKVLVSRWRRKPSHYRPGETVDLGSEFEVPDGDITHGLRSPAPILASSKQRCMTWPAPSSRTISASNRLKSTMTWRSGGSWSCHMMTCARS